MDLGSRVAGLRADLFCLAAGLFSLSAGLALSPAMAQGPFAPRLDISDAIQVDEADSATRTHLQRVKAFLDNEQWEEAVDVLWRIPETNGGKLLAVSPRRFITVLDYCHLQIASLPAEAMKLYRGRVDEQARHWYEEGVRRGEPARLRDVVERLFCSSWGDDALLALGDLAFEAGNRGEARGYWAKILPPEYWARLAPAIVKTNGSPVWLLYPDTDLDPAAIRARLLLSVILDGDLEIAEQELKVFRRECGAAEGKMAGQQVRYSEFLGEILSDSRRWPTEKADRRWPTFAGADERSKVYPTDLEAGAIVWQAALPEISADELTSAAAPGRRVADMRNSLLSYHPVVLDTMVLVNTLDEIRAYNLSNGEPVWGDSPTVFKLRPEAAGMNDNGRGAISALGVPRFTLTVRDRRVYARLGSPVTGRMSEPQVLVKKSHVVCVDLADQGKGLWDMPDSLLLDDDDGSYAFEGSPLVDGEGVYVAMRRSGVRPQQYVACLDPEKGRLKWRRLVCGAETPAQGQEEITHNLLTLHAGTLYCNTNLGAVAAIRARDGQIQWITRYPRARQAEIGKRAKHFYRDLTPCVYRHGVVYVAPSDSELLLALDASTGLLLWQTQAPEDVVHLLGVMDGKLVVSGDKLWWIDASRGTIVPPPGSAGAESFPEGGSPKGLGRGLLAGGKVYWPTWDKIYIFDQQGNRQLEPIHLAVRGATGGNLLAVGQGLLIASHDRLTLFSPDASRPSPKPAAGEKLSLR
jgi:outer membrane protein assembly factor BamB